MTLIYSPERKVVEVYAHTLSSRAPLANVLSKHGFKAPLSSRPLDRSRYDLSRFARPLRDEKPRIEGATVERLYLTEAKALIGHSIDAVSLHLDSGKELQDVIGGRWSDHPFSQPGAILSVTLVVDLVFDGETTKTPLSIVLTEPGRCSLQGEKDPRLKQAGSQILEALGVLKPLHPGLGINDPRLLIQVAKLLECATSPMDGFALAQLGIDIDRFEDVGILTKGERITHKVVDLAERERMTVQLERCADGKQMRYHDPFTGNDVVLLAKHARRWRVDLNWLHEEIVTALGSALQVVRGRRVDEDPVYLGEMDIDGHSVCLYFAAKMSNERQYAKVDLALRLRPTATAGIVLTTTSLPFPFAGTNVVIPVEHVLATHQDSSAIDLAQLKLAYRHGQRAASGSASVSLKVSPDGHAAVLHIPGKAPWQVTSKGKIAVLQRLVNAYANGTPHVNTKALMDGSNCASPANLFSKTSPWRDYLVPVKGARAWQLKVQFLTSVISEDESERSLAEETLNL